MASPSRHGLGRGLGALLPATPSSGAISEVAGIQEIAVRDIAPNPNQPRKDFDINALNDLAGSLKKSGVIQPVVVRKLGSGYQLVVGERRWRAAKLAGLERIPAVVRDVSDVESLELGLVENLLREDLNPIEEAEAYQRLLAEFGWTQDDLAERVSKDRSTISNCLRLLKLPESIRADLRAGRLTMGHARALLSLTSELDQLRLREEILAHSWSVRATEEGVQKKRSLLPRRAARRAPELTALEDSFREALATRVRLVGNERRGRIEIAYTSREDLDRITEILVSRR
jgi:ParB family chromosome partitioning protein